MSTWDGVKRLFWQPAESVQEDAGRSSRPPNSARHNALKSDPPPSGPLSSRGGPRSAPGIADAPVSYRNEMTSPGRAGHLTSTGPLSRSLVGLKPREAIERVLGTLRDVDGVLGSIVVSAGGSILGRDLPAVFEEDVAEELAGRLGQLHEALTMDGGELTYADMHFENFRFQLRTLGGALIGVLLQDGANNPALAMAVNLVARRVQKHIALTT